MLAFPEIEPTYTAILAVAAYDPQAALEQAQSLVTEDTLRQQCLNKFIYGACLIGCERFEEAAHVLEQANQLFQQLNDQHLLLYYQHLQLLGELFRSAPIIEPWLNLIERYQTHHMHKPLLFAVVALGRAYYQLRDLPNLKLLIDQWQAPAQAAKLAFVEASLVRLQGLRLFAIGDLPAADDCLVQAQHQFTAEHLPIESALTLVDRAWLQINQGNLAQGLAWLQQAEACFGQHKLPLRLAICALNQSIGYLQAGQFADALYQSHQARNFYRQVGRSLDMGSCDMQLGRIYSYIGHWAAAAAQLQRAIATFQHAGATGRLASCHYNLAFVLVNHAKYAEALTQIELAEQRSQYDQNQAIFYETALLRAKILAAQSDYAAATTVLAALEQQFAAVVGVAGIARCWLQQGWLLLAQQAPSQAQRWFAQAEPHLVAQPMHYWQVLHGLAACAEALDQAELALDYYEQAIQLVAGLRRQLYHEQLSSFLFSQIAELCSNALTCVSQQQQWSTLLRLSEYQRTLTLQRLLDAPLVSHELAQTQQLQAELLTLLQAEVAEPAQLEQQLQAYAEHIWLNRHGVPPTHVQPIAPDLAAVAVHLTKLHGLEWTVVTFSIQAERLWIQVQTPTEVMGFEQVWEPALERLIARLGSEGSQRRIYHDVRWLEGQSNQPWEELVWLTERLLPAFVQQRLHPKHRLYIVPSGVLHGLAWATLRSAGQWLVERAIIQIVPYLMYLLRPPIALPLNMLQLACCEFGQRAPDLPLAKTELAAIRKIWPFEPSVFVDHACSRATLNLLAQAAQLQTFGIIHIATHAYMHPTQGMAGHIALADGELWIEDITQLRLNQALVMLTVCNGAVVNSFAGEEHISLSWSWLMAGASAVVATLWPLDDGSTIPLMQHFYQMLLAGSDVAQSLSLAQRACIADAQSPIEWGNFMLMAGAMVAGSRDAGGTLPALSH